MSERRLSIEEMINPKRPINFPKLLIRAGEKSKMLILREMVSYGYITIEQATEINKTFKVSCDTKSHIKEDKNLLLLDIRRELDYE